MKQFTKKQRHEFYKKTLSDYDNVGMYGLCSKISDVARLGNFTRVKDHFPELYFFQPKDDTPKGDLWWTCFQDGLNAEKERKIVLQFCIEMTR